MTKRLEHSWVALLMALALAHGISYALLIPLWQAPDEPMLYEYVALTAQLGRVPGSLDQSPALERSILDSLNRHNFWSYVLASTPAALPQTFAEATDLFWMPRQVGGDPPVYFALAALALRLVPGWSIDAQLILLRLLNVALIPALVLSAYAAAREVTEADSHSPIPLAVAALVALHPMLTVIDSAIGNDGLANLLAGVLCWRWLHMLRRGFTWPRALLLGALVVLGLAIKRTLLPYVVLISIAGTITIALRIWHHSRVARVAGIVASVTFAIAIVGWGSTQFDRGATWGWYRWGGHEPAALVASPNGPALVVPAGQAIAYQLPAIAADRAKLAELHFGVRVWSDVNSIGRMVVLNDEKRHEIRFAARPKASDIDTAATIYPKTRGVVLVIEAERGTLYVGNIWATSGETAIVRSSMMSIPGMAVSSPLRLALVYLRLPEIIWSLSSAPILQVLPDGWLEIFYASFWGHFGWMNVPFVRGTAWMGATAIFCALGLPGLVVALRRKDRATKLQLWSLLALCLIAFLLPLVNAIAMPANQATQQGRYLFPAMIPIGLLIATGQSVPVPSRGQQLWLVAWVGAVGIFALSALLYLAMYYRA